MLVQLLHLIPEKFLIFRQHASEWILGVWVKLRKHYVALLVLVSNLNEDQSAVVLVVHQVLQGVSAVHCQERNEISNHRKENRCWHSRKFLSSVSLSKKNMIYLADHRTEKNSDEYTESIFWLYLFCDSMISSVKLVHICWITNLYVSAPNRPYSSVCFRLELPRLVKKWYLSMSVRNAD